MITAGRTASAVTLGAEPRPEFLSPEPLSRELREALAARRLRRGRRNAFTLVELLVVIAIIAILAAILSVAVGAAMTFIFNFTIGMEVTELEMALTQYQQEYGAYPPCIGTVPTAFDTATSSYYQGQFKRHIDAAFRNNREPLTVYGAATPVIPLGDFASMPSGSVYRNATLDKLDASETLPFFLGGASQFSNNVIGLKKDPTRPLTGSAAGSPISFYEFKPEQLVDLDGDGFPSYIPGQGEGQTPFVYFGFPGYKDTLPTPPPGSAPAVVMPTQALMWPPVYGTSAGDPGDYTNWMTDNYDPGVIRPVRDGTTSDTFTYDWFEENGYQLLSAGLDGRYRSDGFLDDGSADTQYPRDLTAAQAADKSLYRALSEGVWAGMTPEDEDNVGNFTEGSTFGDIGLE